MTILSGLLVGSGQTPTPTPEPTPFNPVDYRGPLLATANPTSPTVTQRFLPLTLAPDAPTEFTLAEHMGVANARLVEPHFIGLGVFGTVIDMVVDGERVDTTIIELSDVDERTLFAPPAIAGMANVRWTIAESKDRDGDYITIKEIGSNSFTGDVVFEIYEAIISGVIREVSDTPTPSVNVIPVAPVDVDNTPNLPVMTLPANYQQYNLIGFTMTEHDTVHLPYVLDLQYLKNNESGAIYPDYAQIPFDWDSMARTLTAQEPGFTFSDAYLYTGVGNDSGLPVTPTPTPVATPNNLRGQHVASVTLTGDYENRHYVQHVQLEGGTPRWTLLEHANYLGVHGSDPTIISGTNHAGQFYFRTSDNQWRGIFESGGTLSWDDWNLRSALGDTSTWDLEVQTDAQSAYDNRQADRTNYAFFDGQYRRLEGLALFDDRVYTRPYPYGLPDLLNAFIQVPVVQVSPTQIGWVVDLEINGVVESTATIELTYFQSLSSDYLIAGNARIQILGVRDGAIVGYTHRISGDQTIPAGDTYEIKWYIAEN